MAGTKAKTTRSDAALEPITPVIAPSLFPLREYQFDSKTMSESGLLMGGTTAREKVSYVDIHMQPSSRFQLPVVLPCHCIGKVFRLGLKLPPEKPSIILPSH